jgi:hypothetical protein
MRIHALSVLLAAVLQVLASGAAATSFSFTGSFLGDDSVELFSLTADGASTVTIRTYGYGGGVQADSNVVSSGGFDPMLYVFDSTGAIVAFNDDGSGALTDPNTLQAYDAEVSLVLPVGTYTVAIVQYNNFAVGPNLSNGFTEAGNPNFTGALAGCTNGQFCDVSGVSPYDSRTNEWALDILDVDSAVLVPEPSTMLLLGSCLAGLALFRRSPEG